MAELSSLAYQLSLWLFLSSKLNDMKRSKPPPRSNGHAWCVLPGSIHVLISLPECIFCFVFENLGVVLEQYTTSLIMVKVP